MYSQNPPARVPTPPFRRPSPPPSRTQTPIYGMGSRPTTPNPAPPAYYRPPSPLGLMRPGSAVGFRSSTTTSTSRPVTPTNDDRVAPLSSFYSGYAIPRPATSVPRLGRSLSTSSPLDTVQQRARASLVSQLTDTHEISITFRYDLTGQLDALRRSAEGFTTGLIGVVRRIGRNSPMHATAYSFLDAWEAILNRFATRLVEYANVSKGMLALARAIREGKPANQEMRNDVLKLCTYFGTAEDGWRRIHVALTQYFNSLNPHQTKLATSAIESSFVHGPEARAIFTQIERDSAQVQQHKYTTVTAIKDIFSVWNDFSSLAIDVSTRNEMRDHLPLKHFFTQAEASRIETAWVNVQSSLKLNYVSLVAQGDIIKEVKNGAGDKAARLAATLSELTGGAGPGRAGGSVPPRPGSSNAASSLSSGSSVSTGAKITRTRTLSTSNRP